MNTRNKSNVKLNIDRRRWLSHNKTTVKRLAVACALMFSWLLIWALMFKLGSEILLARNYTNLKDMTFEERIMWDLIPFNYRGTDYWKMRQFVDTILNCFVFAPLGIAFCYIFEKRNILRDALICLGFSLLIESIQLITMLGNPATEDLITNVAGCFIGHIIYSLIFKRLSVKNSAIFFKVVTVFLFFSSAFALVTTAMSLDLIIKIVTRTL